MTTSTSSVKSATKVSCGSEYELTGIWRFLARFAEGKLREADQSYLATLKDGIEAEFEEVEVEAADDSPE